MAKKNARCWSVTASMIMIMLLVRQPPAPTPLTARPKRKPEKCEDATMVPKPHVKSRQLTKRQSRDPKILERRPTRGRAQDWAME